MTEPPLRPIPLLRSEVSSLSEFKGQAGIAVKPADGRGRSEVVFSSRFTLLGFVPSLLNDQKQIWRFPVALAHGRHWKPVLLFLVILVGIILAVDPHDPGYFRHTRLFRQFNRIVSGENAASAMWMVVIGTFGIGLVAGKKCLRDTAICASAAVVDSEFITQIMKGLDRRLRPQDVISYHHLLDSWFKDRGTWYSGPGSFPSGHMIAAMSIATAFAVRYRHLSWAPWVAYGAAGVVGFSRLTLLSHFPSDVFAGGVFGYAICRYVVLPRRSADVQQTRGYEVDEVAEAAAQR